MKLREIYRFFVWFSPNVKDNQIYVKRTLIPLKIKVIMKKNSIEKDIILYFGWYTQNAQGPFIDKGFQFKRGAVAAHIHSYSASTLRTTLKHWSGPLLSRGACAVLGNVYEPFLQMSTHLDLFNARFLAGFTFAEAGWIATPVFSWMQVMIGDPLYQPFIVKS